MKATPANPKPSTGLGLILFLCLAAPATGDAFNATDQNEGAVRVLCLPGHGDLLTGSGFTLAGGAQLIINWYMVACTQEGGQVRVLLDADAREPVTAEIRGRVIVVGIVTLKARATEARSYLATPAISFEVNYP